MRVIAGTARRQSLKTIPGMDTRPTTDRIKETLFNILQPELPGKQFLDLFSGSGAIGIEALSRGCACAVFVENNRMALKCIEENLKKTKLIDNAKVMPADVMTALSSLSHKNSAFDIVFMDPPYGKSLEKEVIYELSKNTCIHEDTWIIVEADLTTDFSYLDDCGFKVLREKVYKTNRHLFLKKKIRNRG